MTAMSHSRADVRYYSTVMAVALGYVCLYESDLLESAVSIYSLRESSVHRAPLDGRPRDSADPRWRV